MRKQTVRDIDVTGKRALVRVDFNVPLDDEGVILDDLRIRAALPTIQYLRERDARVILCSHLGRPKGEAVESLRLAPIAARLSELLDAPVAAARDCIGAEAESAVAKLVAGEALLLENLRFHAEEEANDPAFAGALASLADIFVNDAFGAAHRAHASTVGVAEHLPAVAGLLLEKEIGYLDRIVSRPQRPLGAIIGGAKISDKMTCLRNLLGKADVLIIGGGMANTFLKAQGLSIGDSLVEDDQLDTARGVMVEAEQRGSTLYLPIDVVVADRFAADAEARIEQAAETADGWRIMDAGPRSVAAYGEALQGCRTVVWNGPLGVAEFPQFARGSESLAKLVAGLDAVTVVGGGETVALVREAGLAERFDHVSTGGGAFLEYLGGRELPGIAALDDA
ncbi:MAG: phosphoglycerate kinase [Chloroflexi bacterium]|nr:phosphoglycerate kinase [Chloroflexota bacterium]